MASGASDMPITITTGPVTMRLRQALLDIQTGAAPDEHGWLHTIC